MATALSRRSVAQYAATELSRGVDVSRLAGLLVAYLVDTKKLSQAELLLRDIELVLARDYGTTAVRLTSAHELSAALANVIAERLGELSGAKQVVVTEQAVDPSLIAGLVAGTPTSTFDSSVKTRLKQLRSTV